MKTFKELGLNEPILKTLDELKFKEPSEIQEKAIPAVLSGKDIIGGSATGSGKTLVFGSVIIEKLKRGNGVQALVLVPTRELAEQVTKTLRFFSKYSPLNIISVYGGVSINTQIDNLPKADVVIGTPGRILDHLSRGTINLRNVKILVLDEADRMLDMGFLPDVESIIRNCPRERQTLLFSATIYEEITNIARRYMINPIKISAEAYVDPTKLLQVYYDVPQKSKFSLLVHLLKQEQSKLVMVFCSTRINANFVGRNLKYARIDAVTIHGGLTQNKRARIMEDFHRGKLHVLVCTDVAARGLDIPGVSHIYNYDLPKNDKDYIHRIGRTARAGKDGKAISILSFRDYENFARIQRNSLLDIKKEQLPEIAPVMVKKFDEGRRPNFRRPGQNFHRQRDYNYHRR